MRTVGLLPHEGKAEAMAATVELIRILGEAGLTVRLSPLVAHRLDLPHLGVDDDRFPEGLDLAIALGGDGALLRAARRVYPSQTPLFGINFGHLGFLAEVEAAHLRETVGRLLAGDYRLEDRIMVSARYDGEGGREVVGLNDAVIARGGGTRMISLEVVLNGITLTEYRADGLIVATPTGSTAYSLSAGGPVLHPGVSALVLTPVCAHAMHARPMVVGVEDRIAARVLAPHGEVSLVADGGDSVALGTGGTVHFGRAAAVTRLVRFRGPGFYDILKARLKEGKI